MDDLLIVGAVVVIGGCSRFSAVVATRYEKRSAKEVAKPFSKITAEMLVEEEQTGY
jgi:hypothetical protein